MEPTCTVTQGSILLELTKREKTDPLQTWSNKDCVKLEDITTWSGIAKHTESHAEWNLALRCIQATVAKRNIDENAKVAVFVHGFGSDRTAAFFFRFWDELHAQGFSLLAIDMPGHGLSTSGPLPAKDNQTDTSLLIACLLAFGISENCPGFMFCDAGGAAPFLRTLVKRPDLFGPHHVLTNAVISQVPPTLEDVLIEHCINFKFFLAEGWAPSDQPFKVGMVAQFLNFASTSTHCDMTILVPTGQISIVKAMEPTTYLTGKPETVTGVCKMRSFFALLPSTQCMHDVIAYVNSPASTPPVPEAAPPTQTALEQGTINHNFKVFIRIRPFLPREIAAKARSCLEVTNVKDFPRDPPPQRISVLEESVRYSRQQPSTSTRTRSTDFVFDRVLTGDVDQEQVFQSTTYPMIDCLFNKTNLTVFAYGQTGSGKTHSLQGPPDQRGLMSRCIHAIFDRLPCGQHIEYQYVQLYEGSWLDLLIPENVEPMHVEEVGNHTRLRFATTSTATSATSLLEAVATGALNRTARKTDMNDTSSRSHAVLFLNLVEQQSVCYLVDLAGSERVKRSGVVGTAFNEATAVNASLSALGRIVSCLVANDGKRATHVSYRDNPLTHLLKSGIGGSSKTVLLCCVTKSEDSQSETLDTLKFALQASHVRNKVIQHEVKKKRAIAAHGIANSGHSLKLADDGTGIVALPSGDMHVRGIWTDSATAHNKLVVICLHDAGGTADDFNSIMHAFQTSDTGGSVHVLALSLSLASLADVDGEVVRLLKLFDWLGVVKPTLFGRDLGAVLTINFKLKYPQRADALVLENYNSNYNEKEYKKMMKNDPSLATSYCSSCWVSYSEMAEKLTGNIGCTYVDEHARKKVKKLRGRRVFLWPCQNKGRADVRHAGRETQVGVQVAAALKVQLVDSFGFQDLDVVECVLTAARGEDQ